MKKILYRVFVFIVLFIIVVNVCSMFHISVLGLRLFRVSTGSMEPYLKVNDYIIIKKSKEYKEGDVITYKLNDKVYVTHRIVIISGEDIITKGDANNVEDAPIKKDMIVGKVIIRLGFIGFILYLLAKPLIWILLFLIGLVITIFLPDNKKKKKIKK